MSEDTATRPGGAALDVRGGRGDRLAIGLAWSASEPARAGEVALLPREAPLVVLGRGAARPEDPGPRLGFGPLRPGHSTSGPPLSGHGLSRTQLLVEDQGGQLFVKNVGRAALRVRGRVVTEARLSPGDVFVVEQECALLVVTREASGFGGTLKPAFGFGEPDDSGLVGESPRMWAFRDELQFYARRAGHVLVTGPSGAGKELVAGALHRSSSRKDGPFVARNAATLPAGIIDAELFGNARDYPNPGMRERRGLVGEADGGTLFLDEIGELPEALQAHLLRVLDAGEYHRLGEDRARKADTRLVAATNRDPASLKHDLLARFKLSVDVPGLDERREDIPLLARALLRRQALTDGALAERFFEGGEPRMDVELVAALVRHGYRTHVRELESLLVLAMAGSPAGRIELTDAVRAKIQSDDTDSEPPTRAEVEAALQRNLGNVSKAWQDLGLSSRDVLNRLIKRYGIAVRR